MTHLSPKTIGIIYCAVAISIFAFADICVKTTSMALEPFTVALYLNIFTTLCLLPMVVKNGGIKKALRTTTLKMHFLRAMLMLGNFLCIIYALAYLPVASFYVIVFMMPFILNIMAMVILKEAISLSRWAAIFIAIIGITIALRPESIPLALPALAAFISCFFNAGAVLSVKFIDKNDHWLSYTLYMMIFQTPLIIAIMLFKGIPLVPQLNLPLLLWFMAGGLAYAIGLSLLPQAIKRVDASIIGSLLYIAFPWGVLYGFFIFDDVPDRWTLLGAVIIIASGLFLIYRERKENSKLLELEKQANDTRID